MIKLNDQDIRKQSEIFFKEATKGDKAPLMFDEFIENTLTSLYGSTEFPREIKLCRSLDEMLAGDFSPAEVITMTPPQIKGIPIWRGSTLKDDGVVLRGAGYINGDSRKPCNVALDDRVPHGLLAGATGHGKSVTLNSVIATACLEYPPWYVQFVLADAKIVEMKAYGVGSVIPHISSIAATSDAEFIISVLEDAYNIMMARNSVFTKAGGLKNIKSFMEQTGLCMPHIMITIDEFQTMFMNAAKKAKFINELLAKVARLGRNSGVHLLLASQELGSDLDKNVMGNIGTRLCLGCMPGVSTQVLGNDEAKTNFGKKGRLIINNNPAKENNVDENISLRTPLLPDREWPGAWTIHDYMRELEAVGKKAKHTPFYELSFYDEDDRCYEDVFPDMIKSKSTPFRLYLGEPSFVLRNEDGEKWLRIELSEAIAENILIFSPMMKNRERYLKMLLYNLQAAQKRGYNVDYIIYYSNKDSFSRIDIGGAKKATYIRDFTPEIETVMDAAFLRRILIECDEAAFGNIEPVAADIDLFNQKINTNGQYNGELWQKRVQALFDMYRGPYAAKTGIASISNADKRTSAILGRIAGTLAAFKAMRADVSKVTLDSFGVRFVVIHGLELISQLGVDYKGPRVDSFKKMINESPEYRVFYVIVTSTLEDCYPVRSAINHMLCDNLNSQLQGQMKVVDHYPDTVGAALGVYYLATAEENRCRKFKKMIYKGEII